MRRRRKIRVERQKRTRLMVKRTVERVLKPGKWKSGGRRRRRRPMMPALMGRLNLVKWWLG